jgi:hypothetical protein
VKANLSFGEKLTHIHRSPAQFVTESRGLLLQRKCACGGQCEDCKKKKLQRRELNGANVSTAATAPPVVHQVLNSAGQPLDRETRNFMEPRFGHSFGSVRIHADELAARSAKSVHALAYTVGQHVVFGDGQYVPRTRAGQGLIAHELTHVLQQRVNTGDLHIRSGHAEKRQDANHEKALQIGPSHDAYEREADAASESVMSGVDVHSEGGQSPRGDLQRASMPLLQRKLVVNPTDTVPLPAGQAGAPNLLTNAIQGLLQDTCPDGKFQFDATTGNVTAPNARFCQQPPPGPPWLSADVSSTPVGCQCICDVINNAQTTTVAFQAGGPRTAPGSVPGAGPGQGGVPTDPTISADPRFKGQYRINGRWVDIPFHLIFSHELCGHALPKMLGTHVPRGAGAAGGTPPQEQHAVDVERQIAAEHNLPRRPDDYSGGARERP